MNGGAVRDGSVAGLGRALGALARADQPLGARTTYRVGGTAALLAEPADARELAALSRVVPAWDVPVLVVGRGSNLLVADGGFAGLVVVLGPGFETLSIEGDRAVAGAALSLPVLARRTAGAGWHGLEWAVGVPGSVGGAVRMNAGGHGSDTAATLVSCRWVDLATGVAGQSDVADLRLGYRSSALGPTRVVVEAAHHLAPGDPAAGRAAIDEIVRWRREHQPGGSNAGSVFTNPPGDSAGRLVDACGLRGLRLGTAQVSPKHANFIQADPGGLAADVAALIARVRDEVAAATGVVLHPEVRKVGFSGPGAVAT